MFTEKIAFLILGILESYLPVKFIYPLYFPLKLGYFLTYSILLLLYVCKQTFHIYRISQKVKGVIMRNIQPVIFI